ncbi:MAG: type II secretion system protein GspJ [Sedimentisphaerales bacterium]|jgi:prepilin-type N-terminal cleavage/methylation domain-containing protein
MARRPKHSKAFTLLELLVAMTLMVVTASCLYTALYTGFRAKGIAQAAIEPTLLAINAIELIKQDTYGVLPPTGTLAGAFVGTDSHDTKGMNTDSLEFYTTHIYSSNYDFVGGLGKIELLLEEDNDDETSKTHEGYCLMRKVTTNLLSTKTVESEEHVLCRDVKSLNLRYYDAEDGWLDEWDSTEDANSLPLAMEIDIQVSYKGTSGNAESQTRRLTQSFAIPCGGVEEESQDATSTEANEGQTTSGGQTTR